MRGTSASFPYGHTWAVTLLMLSPGADFDLGIYDSAGRLVASSATDAQEEVTAFRPAATGTYTVVVFFYAGPGDYSLDVSAGSNTPLIEED